MARPSSFVDKASGHDLNHDKAVPQPEGRATLDVQYDGKTYRLVSPIFDILDYNPLGQDWIEHIPFN